MDWPAGGPWQESQQGWIQGIVDVLGWGMIASLLFVIPFLVFSTRAVRRRRFWCDGVGREVEAEFEERGLPGFRRAVSVVSCSVFEPPTDVRCRRQCLDPDVRLRLPMRALLQWRRP